jgi:hypothetical protein
MTETTDIFSVLYKLDCTGVTDELRNFADILAFTGVKYYLKTYVT